ncbi:fungal-specific transcription factor domain-containing protein [Sporodiniella umbellata]|nr:fungal-specific transcription factor domain-containing protein [Sporodiniella umbellata]
MRTNVECVFVKIPRKGPPKSYMESVENRLHRVENALKSTGDPNIQKLFNRSLEMDCQATEASSVSISAPYTTDHFNLQIDRFTINEIGQSVYVNDIRLRDDRIHPPKNNFHCDTQFDTTTSTCNSPLSSTGASFSSHPMATDIPIREYLEADKHTLSQADPLIGIYFEYVHKHIPMIHKKTFMTQMSGALNTPSRLLVYAMCAVASKWSPDQKSYSGNNLIPPGYPYYQKALGLLDEFFDVPRVSTIQALVLLVKYQEYFQRVGYFHRSYAYLGIAARMCLDLGLPEIEGDGVEAETGKRTFWAVFTYDLFMSIEQGRTTYFDTLKCNAGYPTVTTDEGPMYEDIIANQSTFIQLAKILSITYSILRRFTIRKKSQDNQLTQSQIIEEQSSLFSIHTHLENFFYEISQDSFVEPQTAQDPYIGHIYITYYFCIILLHQGYMETQLDKTEFNFMPYPHQRLCVNAAYNITRIVESLQKKFPVYVFTLPIRGVQHAIHCLSIAANIHQYEMLHTEDPVAKSTANGMYIATMHMVQMLSMQSPSLETVKYFSEQHRRRPTSVYLRDKSSPLGTSRKPRPASMTFLETQTNWPQANTIEPFNTFYPQQQPQSDTFSDMDLQNQDLLSYSFGQSPYDQYNPIPNMSELFLADKDDNQATKIESFGEQTN